MAVTATVTNTFGARVNLYIEWFSSAADKTHGYRFDYHGYADAATYTAAVPGADTTCQWSQLVSFTDNGTADIHVQAQAALVAALTAQGVSDVTAV